MIGGMKVILKEHVAKVGRKHEVKEVKSGFGRNFLLPRNLAVLATDGNLRNLSTVLRRSEAETTKRHAEALKNLKKLEGKTIAITTRTNEQGHLFEAIHATTIAQAIKDQVGLEMKPEWIKIAKPIKALGEVALTVEEDKHTASFTLAVARPTERSFGRVDGVE